MPDAIVFNEYAAGGPVEQLNAAIGNNTIGFVGSTDPTVNLDSTQGYTAGALYFNNTPGILRMWRCRDATAGAAKWVLTGVDYANGGTNPPIEVTQFGSAAASPMAEEGNIGRIVNAAGVSPATIGNDNVLAVFSIPASAFDGLAGTNRGVAIQANGGFAATVNNKDVKLIVNPTSAVVGSAVVGGTVLADTGVSAGNNVGWQLNAEVYKYGAPGSNTQLGIPGGAVVGTTHGGLGAGAAGKPTPLTAVESGAILIAVTGNATTATTDIVFNFLNVNALN